MSIPPRTRLLAVLLPALTLAWLLPGAAAQQPADPIRYPRANYTRHDYRIPMRDGKRLYTVVHVPKDRSQKYPILMRRTPYSVAPYSKGQFPRTLGPNKHFAREGY